MFFDGLNNYNPDIAIEEPLKIERLHTAGCCNRWSSISQKGQPIYPSLKLSVPSPPAVLRVAHLHTGKTRCLHQSRAAQS